MVKGNYLKILLNYHDSITNSSIFRIHRLYINKDWETEIDTEIVDGKEIMNQACGHSNIVPML